MVGGDRGMQPNITVGSSVVVGRDLSSTAATRGTVMAGEGGSVGTDSTLRAQVTAAAVVAGTAGGVTSAVMSQPAVVLTAVTVAART